MGLLRIGDKVKPPSLGIYDLNRRLLDTTGSKFHEVPYMIPTTRNAFQGNGETESTTAVDVIQCPVGRTLLVTELTVCLVVFNSDSGSRIFITDANNNTLATIYENSPSFNYGVDGIMYFFTISQPYILENGQKIRCVNINSVLGAEWKIAVNALGFFIK